MGKGLKAVLSVLILLSAVYNVVIVFHTWSLPFNISFLDRHGIVISEAPGIPLPAGLRAGDQIDLSALDFRARSMLNAAYIGRTVAANATYTLQFKRAGASFVTQVTTVPLPPTRVLRAIQGNTIMIMLILGSISVLLLWRGRDFTAVGLALWTASTVVGVTFNDMPLEGVLSVGALLLSLLLFLSSRLGLYLMAEVLVTPLLSWRARLLFRGAFILIMVLGGLQPISGVILLAWSGDAELLLPRYSFLYSWIYVVPVAMFLMGYRLARGGERVKLGWVVAASLAIITAVSITNAAPFGFLASFTISSSLFVLAACSFAYAILRHRLVSVSMVIDRALVYGLVTTLVVGVVAAVNSVVLREALPPGAGLVLQVTVPLALGIALGRLREFLDRIVEQVFFRAKYLSEKALRSFARRAGHFEDTASLLGGAVVEIRRHMGAPAVAVYSVENRECRRLEPSAGTEFPAELGTDDAILVALRAEHRAVDLDALASTLGEDGCAFPMLVLGNLRGIIVVKNRPGEHYGADEKKLLTHVAREVGAAWRILRARDNEALVVALAKGDFPTLEAARSRAQVLTVSWAGA